MNSLVHTEMREVLRENYTWKLAAKTTMCRITSQYVLQNNHNNIVFIDYILYDKSLSSISKIFQHSSY